MIDAEKNQTMNEDRLYSVDHFIAVLGNVVDVVAGILSNINMQTSIMLRREI